VTSRHFDVVVIGGGPGGYAAALYGASAGLDIALIEKNKFGGTCLNVGCIPAKELLETASVFRTVSEAGEFGVKAEAPGLEWGTTMERKRAVVDQLVNGLTGLLKSRKVTLYNGTGALGADHRTVTVRGHGEIAEITGDAVILASGSVPRTIDGFPVDDRRIVTSDEMLSIPELPSSAAVIGGGAIGCEFASMMADLGAKVTILEFAPKILPGCDSDATRMVERSFKRRGIDIRTGVAVKSQVTDDRGVTITFGEANQTLTVDTVVVSIGRRPYSESLGLGPTSVAVDQRGFVEVDEYCRTSVPGVWAVGDLIDTAQLAHVGFAEGILAITDILGETPHPIDYGKVPWCIYCHPEVAFTGHSEESAKEAGYDVVVSKHRWMGNGRALIVGETEGLVKIIAEKQPDGTGGRILGVHMVGPWATEQLGQGYLAVNWEATAAEVGQLIQPHPTLSELFGESVLALTGRSLHG
jgi:dihydrolipoamide dehydrogenase